jgi:pre-mRNA-splicing factor CDC5/CEF1
MLKGGVWKNSEDEILKAAVMKYGLNNWARIASLLTRKTPAQCKARWYEWLDPSVKKTEWTREEDEKLLHLSKIFPTQWQTISPIVGRTAHQCQERYEKLLDETQGRLTLDEHDPRKLRPGEIDPNPEIRPAKADAIDMDDDEKQMLQEARARLANVRGKKATRKVREEMLEEAKRLTDLQRAGVTGPMKRLKRGEIDYNKEIPFETQPAPGVHTFDSEETPKPSLSLTGLTAQKLEGLTRAQKEQHERQEDKERLKKRREAETTEQLLARAEQEAVAFRKINRLVLPDVEDEDDDE